MAQEGLSIGEAPQIVITWIPKFTVKCTFPENPILIAFMMKQAQKIIDKHFDADPNLIQTATEIPPDLPPPGMVKP